MEATTNEATQALVRVKLARGWAGNDKGSTVTVDSVRAEQLKRDGYVAKPKRKRKTTTTTKKKGG